MSQIVRGAGRGMLALAIGLGLSSALHAQNAGLPQRPEPAISQEIRLNGPPAERPAEEPGQAPGPNLFYVPGEYYPEGNGVLWKPGYWAQEQPGWTWIPARWVRQSDGWTFREGSWAAAPIVPKKPADNGAAANVADAGEREIVINLPGAPFVGPAGVTYGVFETFGGPLGLGITPAYVGSPLYGYPIYPNGAFWGGYPAFGWGYGGFPVSYGLGGVGWAGVGYGWGGGIGFGLGPFLWW